MSASGPVADATLALVGCSGESGLVMLGMSYSEPDPLRSSHNVDQCPIVGDAKDNSWPT